MAENGRNLSTKQHRAISALLCTKSVGEAAAATGLGERTITRWLAQSDFRAELTAAEGDLIDVATRRLLQLQGGALDTLEALLVDDGSDVSAGVRLRAAQVALDHLLKLREMRDIEQRLQALEAATAERGEA